MKKVVVVILLLTLGYFQYRLWVGQNSLSEIRELQVQIESLQADIAAQESTNAQLQAEVEALRNAPESGAMEEQVRERLGRVLENETLYLFVDDE